MANGVLGLGSGQASTLNSDLIDKLKTAERKSTVEPIETKITKIATEKETFSSVQKKVTALLDAVKPFDLFISGGVTAFEQKTATTSGDSATFDAADVKSLSKGFTTVDVTQLAQKDVYQSNTVNAATKNAVMTSLGDLTISANGTSSTFVTEGKTYQQLADEITAKSGMNASVEQVGTDSYRLVVKSEDSGTVNQLTITGAASQALGFTTDGTTVNTTNHILTAKDMMAKVDGVEYNAASNTLTVDGLKITANKVGVSSINVVEDNTQLETQMKTFVDKYNELVALVETESQSTKSALGDKSSIRNIISQIKDKLFGSYGATGDKKSVFNFGIELDKYGSLSLDSTKFNKAVQTNISSLKDLFAGTAENKGLGTVLKETLDGMTFTGGLLDSYEKAMLKRETTLNDEKEKAQASLDLKYEQLALQFSSYGTIITQMESSFSGLKMLIQQSTASN
jgi:flagellar hook-associated protein 2